jgi:hypothetical protein
VAALAGFTSGEIAGDEAFVVVTNSSAAQTYLLGLAGPDATSAGGSEWSRSTNGDNTTFRCGRRAFDVLRGAFQTPPTVKTRISSGNGSDHF